MSNSGCFSLWFTPCSQDAIVIQCDINDQQHFSWPGLLKMSARKHQSWSMSWLAQVVCLTVHRHFEIWGLLMSKTLWLWRTFTLQLLCLLHMLLSRVSFFVARNTQLSSAPHSHFSSFFRPLSLWGPSEIHWHHVGFWGFSWALAIDWGKDLLNFKNWTWVGGGCLCVETHHRLLALVPWASPLPSSVTRPTFSA